MLLGKQNAKTMRIQNIHPIVFLPLLIAVIIAISACSALKGSIIILENPNGTGFTMNLNEWSSKNKGELLLNKGDVLQIEVAREEGKIDLEVQGKNGSNPYEGDDLESGVFTVTVSETDKYYIRITGKDATGNVKVKNVEKTADIFYCRIFECSFELPQSWENKYEIEEKNNNIVYVYHKAIREKYGEGTGLLFYIEMLHGDNLTQDDITDPGNRTIALQEDGYTYVFGMPTDVQYPVWEGGDKTLADDYIEMTKDNDKIKKSIQRLQNIR